MNKLLLTVIIIMLLGVLSACNSIPSPATTSVPTQSRTVTISPVTATLPSPTFSISPTLLPPFTISPTPTPSVTNTVSPSTTGHPNTITFGSRTLNNNTWGAPSDETLTSEVFLKPNGNYGWYWSREEPKIIPGNTGVQPIYPSVRVGASPTEQSNAAYFPIQINAIKSLTFLVAYNYLTIPTGPYNLAFDMFFSDTNRPGSTLVRKAEVMVWIHGTFTQPSYTYKGDFTDAYNTYALYSWTMPGNFLYCSFISKGQLEFQAQDSVEVKNLIDNLNLDPTWYLLGVEFGNEITNGSGQIEISKLVINLNGLEP